jgi:hypothetical protein
MRTLFGWILAVMILVGFATLGLAVEKGNWTGWISDENCAKDYAKAAKPEHKGCAASCMKRGAKAALATEKGLFLLDLGETKVEDHLGFAVKIEGELNKETNTIKVSSVAKADK